MATATLLAIQQLSDSEKYKYRYELLKKLGLYNIWIKIKIKEYQTPESNTDRYSASFKYNGLEYFLIGTMGEEEFNNIINNLFFSR